MRWMPSPAGILVTLALASVACLSGCERAGSDARDARDRYLRRAFAAREAEDIDQAIALCERALARRPDLALAHRELALMLDNYRRDYATALYHYQRYLQLRPDSPQRADIEELMRHCRAAFALEFAESSGELKRVLQARDERIRKLEREVALLRAPAAPVVAPGPAPAPPAAAPAAAPVPAAVAPRTHVVQAGESLGTIASRYYGTPARWKTIFDANRDQLPDANRLRVGVTLVIPAE